MKRVASSSEGVKVAMIGAGGRARSAHYPSLRDMADVAIVAVCDLNEARMNQVAEEYGIPAQYTDYAAMIEREKPDVVYAIMPPQHVYDLAANIMEMGVHLVIEKPPAVTTEQANQMALLAKKKWGDHRRDIPKAVRARDPHRQSDLRAKRAHSQRGYVFLQKRGGRATDLQGRDGKADLRWDSRGGYPAVFVRGRSGGRGERRATLGCHV